MPWAYLGGWEVWGCVGISGVIGEGTGCTEETALRLIGDAMASSRPICSQAKENKNAKVMKAKDQDNSWKGEQDHDQI